MSKIVLYDQENFNGEAKEFVRNVPDLSKLLFNNAAKSARVVGYHWIGFVDADYNGKFIIFAPGDYKTLGCNFNHMLSSLRLVDEDLQNPEIVLYEHVEYDGEVLEIKQKTDDLTRGNFNEKVSSHKVKRGVWILHRDINQEGPRQITFQGDNWNNYRAFGWNDTLSSLFPLVKSYTEVGASPSVKLGQTCM